MKKLLHIISTGQQTSELFIKKVMAIHQQVDFIHIRERSWTAREMINMVEKLVASGVPERKIIINDRVDVALESRARGVQLPAHSIDVSFVKEHHPHVLVGCSVHSVQEAIEKERAGADYLLYGHIFKTQSKAGVEPRGIDALREITNNVTIPVIAIGGISPAHVPSVIEAGASGIAVLSGILLAKDPVAAVDQYKQALEGTS